MLPPPPPPPHRLPLAYVVFLCIVYEVVDGAKEFFDSKALDLSSVTFILTLTAFFVVIYSQVRPLFDRHQVLPSSSTSNSPTTHHLYHPWLMQGASKRFADLYDKACSVCAGVQDIAMWVGAMFPGKHNAPTRWEIMRQVRVSHLTSPQQVTQAPSGSMNNPSYRPQIWLHSPKSTLMRQVVGAQFLLFLGLNGQVMDEANWEVSRLGLSLSLSPSLPLPLSASP